MHICVMLISFGESKSFANRQFSSIISELSKIHKIGCTVILDIEYGTMEQSYRIKETRKTLSSIYIKSAHLCVQNNIVSQNTNGTCNKNRPLHVIWLTKSYHDVTGALQQSKLKVGLVKLEGTIEN